MKSANYPTSGPGSAITKGVVYSLPKSVYTISIKPATESGTTLVKVAVTPDLRADDVSFSIQINRNPIFARDQNYVVNSKGLLMSASTVDVGKLPEIFVDLAKSIVAVINPAGLAGGMPGAKLMGDTSDSLDPDEYTHFYNELKKANVEFTFEPGMPARPISFPGENGAFQLVVTPPMQNYPPLDENDIRSSLKQAARRTSQSPPPNPDEVILADGVMARPLTSAEIKYVIQIKKSAINSFREKQISDVDKPSNKQIEKIRKQISELNSLITEKGNDVQRMGEEAATLSNTRNLIHADGKRSAEILQAITKDASRAKELVDSMVALQPEIERTDAFLRVYGEALDSLPAAGNITPEQRKAVIGKFTVLNTTIQALVAIAKTPIQLQIDDRNKKAADFLKEKEKLAGDLKSGDAELEIEIAKIDDAKDKFKPARSPIPLIAATNVVAMVDESRAQLVPMRRSPVGTFTNTVNLNDGVVTSQDVVEESEVLGAVAIPLKVVQAIFSTTQSLWASKETSVKSQTAYLKAEAELINARAALKEAEKKDD